MINFILKRFSGSHYRKFYRQCRPIVEKINRLEQEYQSLTDDQLRAKTPEFKERIQNGEHLDDLLPEAFAVVKNTARRLCGQTITVREHELQWNMVHYDVQLIGGIALHNNMVAEMQTGEGKTLVSTLSLYLNALTGRNCQLITVNEYLAQRDSEWMGYIFKFHGMTVGCLLGSHQQTPDQKREMYACDITYGTASEFGFDYLRDNGMATRKTDQVQRDHYYCIVDEVDSILIDEARTPLIISGPSQDGDTGEGYKALRPAIDTLVKTQMQLCNRLAQEAKNELEKEGGNAQSAYEKLLQVKLGTPRNKVYMRLMEDGAIRKAFDAYDLEMHGDHYREQRYELKENLYYTMDEKQHTADLTENGRNFLRPNDEEAFVLPDLPTTYMELDKDESLTPEVRDQKKAEAQTNFERVSEEIHVISQLLRAYSLYERDIQYVVQGGKVMIVDENTGRVMPGRRWSDGLHQAVEAKENVPIEQETKTYATITLQNYFRLYDKLAGMTGTAETEANEFSDIYDIKVMVIPTNRPNIREDDNDIIYKTRREKFNAAIEEIKDAHKKGQPCLVGTVSVESSELLSRMLKRAHIPHSVLNAKYHEQEADIVSKAGQKGAVTIATNMAGRGTDIKLGEEISDLGGLYVIGTERHMSRRIDRQLRGRCARQGDPGRSKFFLSLEDDLMRLYSNQGLAGKWLEKSFTEGEPLEHKWLNPAIERAQKSVEQHHYSVRKRLLQFDDVLNQQREVIYGLRNEAIHTENPKSEVFTLIEEEIDNQMDIFNLAGNDTPDADQVKDFVGWVITHFPVPLRPEDLKEKTGSQIREEVLAKINEAYTAKEKGEDQNAIRSLERWVIIHTIDKHWQDHLTAMEDLRQSVNLRSYGQKDPLQEYKSEAFTYFEEMMGNIRSDICLGIFRSATSANAFENLIALIAKATQKGPAEESSETETVQKKNVDQLKKAAAAHQAQIAAQKAEAMRRKQEEKKEVKIPDVKLKIKAAPGIDLPGRNDTVVIRKGDQEQTLKFKKAKLMIETEGWRLVKKV